MPGQEVALVVIVSCLHFRRRRRRRRRGQCLGTYRAVDGQRLVDVDGDEVVISGFSARGKCRVGDARLRLQTLDCGDICLLLGAGESLPTRRVSLLAVIN